MVSDKMKELMKNNSVIRQMFEEGKKLVEIYGKENVFDFSLGNPSVPTPDKIASTIKNILETETSTLIHGYMSNSGFDDVRENITNDLNKRFNTSFSKVLITPILSTILKSLNFSFMILLYFRCILK